VAASTRYSGGAGAAVVQSRGHAGGALEEFGGLAAGKARGGGLLDDLLVAALGRAIARAEGEDLALAVAEKLHLDVAGAGDELLEEKPGIPEVRPARLGNPVVCRTQPGCILTNLHPDAAAAGGAFQHHGISDRLGRGEGLLDAGKEGRALEQRDAVRLRDLAGGVFEPEAADLLRRGPDPGDAARLAGLGEVGVFGKETVAGMESVDPGEGGDFEKALRVEVGLRNRRGTEEKGLVRHPHMRRVAVGFGIHRDRADPEALEGAEDAAGDLAAVGDEDFGEHVRKISPRSAPRRALDCRRCRDC
jgi:hypothetical protein